ncbi:MAG: sensor histidine kinase [Microbacteriaceae bacterium]|nr:sensor histidine kinase [Microbacteriaceae bacterium]
MTRSDSATWVRPSASAEDRQKDVILAAVVAVATVTTSLLYARTGMYEEVAPVWLWVLGLALCTAPLALRRRWPVPVAVTVAIGFFTCGQFGVPEALMVNICLFIALYTVGAWEPNRRLAVASQVIIALSMIAWLVVSLIISSSNPDWLPGVSRVGLFSAFATFAALQIIMNLMYFAGAFFFGMNSWRAAHTKAVLEAQGRELELERQPSAAQAVALDRLGIARELHDVVAHHVSVMGVQAAAARLSLRGNPDAAERSLEIVEQSAQDAVGELRTLVHTLRSPEADEPGSTVGVAQLGTLVAESQRAGTPATLIVSGTPRALPLLVDVALYRVAQEALTNVRKDAGRGAAAEVRLRFGAEQVEIEVVDNGVRQGAGSSATLRRAATDGSGLGLRGMRERLGAVGGRLEAGRRDPATGAQGYLVRATVPLPDPPAPETSPRPDNAHGRSFGAEIRSPRLSFPIGGSGETA